MIGRTLAALAASLMLSAVAEAGDAPMFRGNLAHTGVYSGKPIKAAPKVKWMFHTKGRVIASPAVVGGVVYAASTDGRLYAIDGKTGAEKWHFASKARIASSPAVDGPAVFFESYDGNFYAVDAKSGALKWNVAVPGERRFTAPHLHGSLPVDEAIPDPFDFYLSSPAVFKGAVYFGSGNGNVYALDENSGAQKWVFKTGDTVHASPAIADGVLYIGSWDSYLYALDAATGAEKWRFKTGEDHDIHNQQGIQSSPAVANGVVYFGCRDSNIYAVSTASGKELWHYNNGGSWAIASPAVSGGKVIAATADTGLFLILDAKSGAKIASIDFHHWLMFSSPAVVGGYAYIGSHSGKLLAIDLAHTKEAWEFQTEGSKANLAGITNAKGEPDYDNMFDENFTDDLYVGVDRFMRIGSVLSSPVVADGMIVFGGNDGNLYSLE
jgi:outer membrane protein assembly factor BamB